MKLLSKKNKVGIINSPSPDNENRNIIRSTNSPHQEIKQFLQNKNNCILIDYEHLGSEIKLPQRICSELTPKNYKQANSRGENEMQLRQYRSTQNRNNALKANTRNIQISHSKQSSQVQVFEYPQRIYDYKSQTQNYGQSQYYDSKVNSQRKQNLYLQIKQLRQINRRLLQQIQQYKQFIQQYKNITIKNKQLQNQMHILLKQIQINKFYGYKKDYGQFDTDDYDDSFENKQIYSIQKSHSQKQILKQQIYNLNKQLENISHKWTQAQQVNRKLKLSHKEQIKNHITQAQQRVKLALRNVQLYLSMQIKNTCKQPNNATSYQGYLRKYAAVMGSNNQSPKIHDTLHLDQPLMSIHQSIEKQQEQSVLQPQHALSPLSKNFSQNPSNTCQRPSSQEPFNFGMSPNQQSPTQSQRKESFGFASPYEKDEEHFSYFISQSQRKVDPSSASKSAKESPFLVNFNDLMEVKDKHIKQINTTPYADQEGSKISFHINQSTSHANQLHEIVAQLKKMVVQCMKPTQSQKCILLLASLEKIIWQENHRMQDMETQAAMMRDTISTLKQQIKQLQTSIKRNIELIDAISITGKELIGLDMDASFLETKKKLQHIIKVVMEFNKSYQLSRELFPQKSSFNIRPFTSIEQPYVKAQDGQQCDS